MSLTLVLAAWALVLLIPAVVRLRNRGIATSVSKFHHQLIVLGRTSTVMHNGGHLNTTETYVWAHASSQRTTQFGHTDPMLTPSQMRRIREAELRQRRSLVLFSLLILVLVSALVTILALSPFTLAMTAISVVALVFYVAMLIRIKNLRAMRAMRAQYAGSEEYGDVTAPAAMAPTHALGAAKSPPIRIAPTFEPARVR